MDDPGYILAVLLIGMALAAIWMSALLPAWRHQAQRDRERELIFRGEQYARAIVLYNRKLGTLPPSIDALVEGKFLRRKYLDPVTGCEFVPIGVGISTTLSTPCPHASNERARTSFDPANQGSQIVNTAQGGQTGVTGVRSLSTETSIVVYQNQQQHNLWQFDYQLQCQQMGGCGQPGGQNPRGGGPGGGRDAPGGRAGGGRQGGGETPPIVPGGRQGGGRQGGGRQGGGQQGGGRGAGS